MVFRSRIIAAACLLCALGADLSGAQELPLECGPFAVEAPLPAPREAASAVQRFELVKYRVKTQAYNVFFLGDSLTERFDEQTWREHMEPRGVLNAGVSGDRTENLRWRLRHGNLDRSAPPAGVVVLIGTNDLTYGGTSRPPNLAAEGIRGVLLDLRQLAPSTRILLLGLLPRSASPDAYLRRATVSVNEHIRKCEDQRTVTYANIGGVLLDSEGRLRPEIAPDQLHFSPIAYSRLVQRLDPLLDALVGAR
jgi:lysophospholipase L1-like esterase